MCKVVGITFYTFCVVPTLPGQKKRYAMLQSLDLICDSEVEQQLWLEKVSEMILSLLMVCILHCLQLKTFITPKSHLFSNCFAHTDPAILYPYM